MYIALDGIVKGVNFDVEKRTTKIKLFDLELGDDIDLKFPGDLIYKPGTPVKIEGLFRIYKFGSGSYFSAVPDKHSIHEVGKIVLNQPAVK